MNFLYKTASWAVGHFGMAILLIANFSGKASANPFDDCILKFMGTAQNESAVYAIERSCISKTSIDIPEDEGKKLSQEAKAFPGTYNLGGYTPETGLVIHVKNTTGFAVTQMLVSITNKATHVANTYPVFEIRTVEPQGVTVTGMPDPALAQILQKGAVINLFVAIDEVRTSGAKFGERYNWDIRAIKGIPTN